MNTIHESAIIPGSNLALAEVSRLNPRCRCACSDIGGSLARWLCP